MAQARWQFAKRSAIFMGDYQQDSRSGFGLCVMNCFYPPARDRTAH